MSLVGKVMKDVNRRGDPVVIKHLILQFIEDEKNKDPAATTSSPQSDEPDAAEQQK